MIFSFQRISIRLRSSQHNKMRLLLVQCLLLMNIFVRGRVYSLPAINFTSHVLTNRMIEALSEALVARDRPKSSIPFYQHRQQAQQPSYQQLFVDQQQPQPLPSYQPEYQFYQTQLPEQQYQPSAFFQGQQPEQLPVVNYYQTPLPEQHQQASPFYQPQIPDPAATNFYQTPLPEQTPPPYYPQSIPDPQQQFMYQLQVPDKQPQPQPQAQPSYSLPAAEPQHHQPQPSFPIQVPEQQHHQPQPSYQMQVPEQQHHQPQPQSNHVYFSQQPGEPQPASTHPPQKPEQHPIYYPQHPVPHPQPVPELPQHVEQAGPHFYYPFGYENPNWYNFGNVWSSVKNNQLESKTPLQVVNPQPVSSGAGDCPTGFCPLGASCSQFSGQWQCACGQNGCSGIQNPCGIFGRYYFPYYPDPSRFIQCDQTGVFWIRRCAPGTVFDPKISVCNYPPVVVETRK